MLLLGHAGITLGAALLLAAAVPDRRQLANEDSRENDLAESCPPPVAARDHIAVSKASWLTYLGNRVDIRLLLVASLLPDIIDKPIGAYLLAGTFSSGRIFCHTLLFLALLTFAGIYLYRSRGRTWLLVLSFGTLTHLILDEMWLAPRTLLWPLYGSAFEPVDLSDWTLRLLRALLHDPGAYLPEILGGAILIWFLYALVRRNMVYAFIKRGVVS